MKGNILVVFLLIREVYEQNGREEEGRDGRRRRRREGETNGDKESINRNVRDEGNTDKT